MIAYKISEDMFFLGLRGANSIVDIHETLESAEREYIGYISKDIYQNGYRLEQDELSFDTSKYPEKIPKMINTYTKWFGLCKRVVTLESCPIRHDCLHKYKYEQLYEKPLLCLGCDGLHRIDYRFYNVVRVSIKS